MSLITPLIYLNNKIIRPRLTTFESFASSIATEKRFRFQTYVLLKNQSV